jgi:hypothetical protein
MATSGMLLSYVDFFSGLSSETPEKTRIGQEAQRPQIIHEEKKERR